MGTYAIHNRLGNRENGHEYWQSLTRTVKLNDLTTPEANRSLLHSRALLHGILTAAFTDEYGSSEFTHASCIMTPYEHLRSIAMTAGDKC